MGDPPWVNPQTWVDNSPFLHLDHIDSPLLIAVGTHGMPGEQAQAEQLFAGLRRLNRTTELRHYNGEGHSPSTWSPPPTPTSPNDSSHGSARPVRSDASPKRPLTRWPWVRRGSPCRATHKERLVGGPGLLPSATT
jgi:hypothetical protein